jgi:hypothetical protein
MAAISTYLARIKSAILGEEVRGAIYDSIKAINDENVNVLNNCKTASNEAVKAYNDAKKCSESANTAANEACEAEDNAYTYMANTLKLARYAKQSVAEIDEKVAVVTSMKSSLLDSYQVTDDLLDSSGDSLFDSAGRNLTGAVVLAEMGYVASLEKRIEALEVVIKSITSK